MKNILLTGFAPFGGETVNPSWEAVRQLEGTRVARHRVHARELPVEFHASLKTLRKQIRELKPDVIVCVGQAGGRNTISLERIAINVDDARIPDNAGAQPVDEAIVEDGPDAYFTRLPIKTLLRDLKAAGVPAAVSQTAGTFVCNHVFYGLLHAVRKRRNVKAGFIHIPFSPEQAARQPDAPSLDVETVVRALNVVLESCVRTEGDIKLGGGAEH